MKKMQSSTRLWGGLTAAILMLALVGSAGAASSEIAYNKVGITLFDKPQVTAGEFFLAPNGQQVPSSITYTDATGGKTNYLSVRQISELLDTQIAWNGKTGSVDIAPSSTDGGVTIHIPEKAPNARPSPDDVTVIVGKSDPLPTVPVYGTQAGAFQEVDPKTVNTTATPTTIFLEQAQIKTEIGFPDTSNSFSAEFGKYVVYTVINNGTSTQNITVKRNFTVANGVREHFTTVALAPGKTLVRAFAIAADASPLESVLTFGMYPEPITGSTDVTVSLAQYR